MLVHRRINEIFSEGQLDDCDLTLRDLNAIAGAIVGALAAVYHSRQGYGDNEPKPPADPADGAPLQLVPAERRGS